MPEINGRLKYLFHLYKENLASEKEMEELSRFLHSESTCNLELLFEEYGEQAQNTDSFFSSSTSEKILANIFSHQHGSINDYPKRPSYLNSFTKYSIAAILLITCVLSLIFMLNRPGFSECLEDEKQVIKKTQKILPGSNKAVLKLADGSVIVLDNEKNGWVRDQKNLSIIKRANGQLVFKVKNFPSEENSSLLNLIETPKGGQYQVILPDNTIVWLNAASSIQFPSAFSGKYRKVKITGEVYFEVAKNATMPFIVESRNAEIEVLGTHFNVMDYNDELIAKTTLLEGSVKILNRQQTEILKPGQEALYGEHATLKLENAIDPSKSIAWKNGFFVFEDSSIELIMRQVSRWYDVKVSFEGPIYDNEFTGKISRNVKLEEFLKILSYAGFNFKIEGKNLRVIN